MTSLHPVMDSFNLINILNQYLFTRAGRAQVKDWKEKEQLKTMKSNI